MSALPGPISVTNSSGSAQDEIEQLKLANHYLRVAMDQVNEGVLMFDCGPMDGTGPRVLFSNMPIACLVGVEPARGLRGLHLADLLGTERDVVAVLSALRDASNSGAAECQAQIKTFYSRGTKYCTWRIKALHDPMKRLLNFTVTVMPVPNEFPMNTTALANQPKAEDLDAQSERLRVENLAAMAQGIAHDVNNLLGPIAAQLSLVLPQLDANTELAQTLENVLAAARRAKSFTSQVVKAAKARHSTKQPTDVTEIIRDTVNLAQAGSNVEVRITNSADLKAVMADPIKITQVLQNLVLNGIQAMPSGGFMDVETRNVTLRQGQDPELRPGAYVEIVVRDRGAGITPDNMRRLFQESFTTKADGNGIGLTTCKRFIDEHHGAIRVASTVNVGTEFRILLPSLEQQSDTARLTPTKRPTGLRQGKGSILIVDDEVNIRSVAALILKRCGYSVFECDSGETALKTYQQMSWAGKPFDLVIMDLTLRGGMEGLETSHAIWKTDPTARIIVSSGSVTDDVQRSFMDQGFIAILPKPYEAPELSEAVYAAVMAPTAAPQMELAAA